MISSKSAKRQSGFTLVELLIVAIILAILAAIIVPQFASTTTDATESALRANVTGMRSAIDLYRQQHGEYPGVNHAVPAAAAAPVSAVRSGRVLALVTRSRRSKINSRSIRTATAGLAASPAPTFPFGPYIQEDVSADQPDYRCGAVAIVTTGDLNMTPADAGCGWKYDTVTGKFIVDDSTLDSQGVAYSTY